MPRATLVLLLWAGVGAAPATAAQEGLEVVVGLYTAAAYDEALTALERVRPTVVDPAERVSVDRYRMLCLLALGRTADAEAVIGELLEGYPSYSLSEADASPRVLRTFTATRLRALPGVVRRRYASAKALYDGRQFEQAAVAFAVVNDLLADPSLSSIDASLTDLGQLSQGFKQLSLATVAATGVVDAAPPKANAGPPPVGTALGSNTAAEPAAAVSTDAVPAARDVLRAVYELGDHGVIPPVAIRQDILRWFGPMRPPLAGATLGTIEVVIDEAGHVIASVMRASVSRFYDAVLLDSARSWQYQPASRGGQPVKYRRVVVYVYRS